MSSHKTGSWQSASVVIIQSFFALFMAEVIASFLGELEFLLFLIILKFISWFLKCLVIIVTELSVESSSTKRISKCVFKYCNFTIESNKILRFLASFLNGTIIEKVVLFLVLSSLSSLSAFAAVYAMQGAAAIPIIVFFAIGLVCFVIGFLGTDRAVAKIWGNK